MLDNPSATGAKLIRQEPVPKTLEELMIREFISDKTKLEETGKRLRKFEDEKLKEAAKQEYGIFALSGAVMATHVSCASSYRYTDNDCPLVKMNPNDVKAIIDKSDEDLFAWGERFKLTSYDARPVDVSHRKYHYRFRIHDADDDTIYAFDPRFNNSERVVRIDDRNASLDEYVVDPEDGKIDPRLIELACAQMRECLAKSLDIAKKNAAPQNGGGASDDELD